MDYKELYGFLKTFTGENYDDSTPDLSLSGDLGIYGDDAEELVLGISSRFQVDISSFKFSDYFESEGDGVSKFIAALFNKSIPKKDLRISDLKKAIQSGRLN